MSRTNSDEGSRGTRLENRRSTNEYPRLLANLEVLGAHHDDEGKPEDDVIKLRTSTGYQLVDRKLWFMSTQDVMKLEPVFMAALKTISIAMIPREWPELVRHYVEAAVEMMDPRKTFGTQKVYREAIYNKLSKHEGPSVVAILAIAFETGTEGQEGCAYFQVLPVVLGATRTRQEVKRPERASPLYIVKDDGSLLVRQVDLTPLTLVASWADYDAIQDGILVMEDYAVIRPPIITNAVGSLVEPECVMTHPFFNCLRYVKAAPVDHPLSQGEIRPRVLSEQVKSKTARYKGPVLIRTHETYANAVAGVGEGEEDVDMDENEDNEGDHDDGNENEEPMKMRIG
ncbi:hypothetical protein QBC37DRAFT_407126 [Rhypophila decipiens]|uniref:Uncharacterized protein n=1 Tax=Rhypophila decipiens TaxID=261697 RepID=A0AAN6XTQ5_9PEZI|nr:hypothetical protein QBC37DRAFT_407126 [Rhypophila decipiens]